MAAVPQLVEAVPVSGAAGRSGAAPCISSTFGGIGATDRCYAWSSQVEGSDQGRFFAVLHTPPLALPADAVRAAIAQEPAPDRHGDPISTYTDPAKSSPSRGAPVARQPRRADKRKSRVFLHLVLAQHYRRTEPQM